MKVFYPLLLLALSLLSGCVTNDLKVVDALHRGMTVREARSTVESFGFKRSLREVRPSGGWASEDPQHPLPNLPGRAKYQEEQLAIRISEIDYYPVGHGLMGLGMLFLFYDSHMRLAHYYRYQIN